MKKVILSAVAAACALSASAIGPNIFNHLGASVGVGTTGITIDVATPITGFVQMRAGVDIMPGITFNADADFNYYIPTTPEALQGEMSLKGDLGRTQGHVIFNVYPIPKCGLFVAAGGYFGGKKLLKITGHSDELADYAGVSGQTSGSVIIGDYEIPADKDGNVSGGLRVKSFRPYLGIGWGRAIPGKLLNFQTELGVQFEGKPEVYTDHGTLRVSELEEDNNTFNKVRKYLKVYPQLTFRLGFRAF